MEVYLLGRYLVTCLLPSITKHRWEVLTCFLLIHLSCVEPGASQEFRHLLLPRNISEVYCSEFCYKSVRVCFLICGSRIFLQEILQVERMVIVGDGRQFICFESMAKGWCLISGLPPMLGPVVLAIKLGSDALFICCIPAVTLMGKINEMVAVAPACELGKSLRLCGFQCSLWKAGKEGFLAERTCWMNKRCKRYPRCCRAECITGCAGGKDCRAP